ncbi:MAG: PA2779 family protein [Woeseiaceae bacterium]|nr:PA2779 family protein [Woeseiaceae bacterium]
MTSTKTRSFLFRLLSVALVSLGFMQAAPAGMIGTGYLIENDARGATIDRIDVLLASDAVRQQLEALGVEPSLVTERLQGLTDAELLALENRIDTEIAGGDALGIIGAVFLVLLILELVGVTDIFKSL